MSKTGCTVSGGLAGAPSGRRTAPIALASILAMSAGLWCAGCASTGGEDDAGSRGARDPVPFLPDRLNHLHSDTNQKLAQDAVDAFEKFTDARTGLGPALLKNLDVRTGQYLQVADLRSGVLEDNRATATLDQTWDGLLEDVYFELGVVEPTDFPEPPPGGGAPVDDAEAHRARMNLWAARLDRGMADRQRRVTAVAAVLDALVAAEKALVVQDKADVQRVIDATPSTRPCTQPTSQPGLATTQPTRDDIRAHAQEELHTAVDVLLQFRQAIIASGRAAQQDRPLMDTGTALQRELIRAAEASRDRASAYALVAVVGSGLREQDMQLLDRFMQHLSDQLDEVEQRLRAGGQAENILAVGSHSEVSDAWVKQLGAAVATDGDGSSAEVVKAWTEFLTAFNEARLAVHGATVLGALQANAIDATGQTWKTATQRAAANGLTPQANAVPTSRPTVMQQRAAAANQARANVSALRAARGSAPDLKTADRAFLRFRRAAADLKPAGAQEPKAEHPFTTLWSDSTATPDNLRTAPAAPAPRPGSAKMLAQAAADVRASATRPITITTGRTIDAVRGSAPYQELVNTLNDHNVTLAGKAQSAVTHRRELGDVVAALRDQVDRLTPATIAKNLQPTTRATTQLSCRSDPRELGQSLFTDLLGTDSRLGQTLLDQLGLAKQADTSAADKNKSGGNAGAAAKKSKPATTQQVADAKAIDALITHLGTVVADINQYQAAATQRIYQFIRDLLQIEVDLDEENLRHFDALHSVALEEFNRWQLLSEIEQQYIPVDDNPQPNATPRSTVVPEFRLFAPEEEITKSWYRNDGRPAGAAMPTGAKLHPFIDRQDSIYASIRRLAETAREWQRASPAADDPQAVHVRGANHRLREALGVLEAELMLVSFNDRLAASNSVALRTEIEEHDLNIDGLVARAEEAGLRVGLQQVLAFHSTGVTEADIEIVLSTVRTVLLQRINSKL